MSAEDGNAELPPGWAAAQLARAARADTDPMTWAHVDVSVPATHGSIRLHSATSEESLWVSVRDPDGAEVIFDHARRAHEQAAVRLTPSQARALSDVLRRYADAHKDTP